MYNLNDYLQTDVLRFDLSLCSPDIDNWLEKLISTLLKMKC